MIIMTVRCILAFAMVTGMFAAVNGKTGKPLGLGLFISAGVMMLYTIRF